MKHFALTITALTLLMTPVSAQEEIAQTPVPSPNQIVDGAKAEEWIAIAASDLLVMDLVPDRDGNNRQVIIQLMPKPFSQGWVRNIRKLAAAQWWDDTSINRVQDNYVVQWGDAGYDNPESGETEQKPLPEGLEVVPESAYLLPLPFPVSEQKFAQMVDDKQDPGIKERFGGMLFKDIYAQAATFVNGWPFGAAADTIWPVHCYGMVGVGRNLSPDTGTGAELYTVIGHAPRHLDRNIALVGRIIEGMEHLSSLPRGKGVLGFYEDASKRTSIQSIRVATDLLAAEQPRFEYLSTEGPTFAKYAEARANRRDPFFNVPAGGADICNITVPVRRVAEGSE